MVCILFFISTCLSSSQLHRDTCTLPVSEKLDCFQFDFSFFAMFSALHCLQTIPNTRKFKYIALEKSHLNAKIATNATDRDTVSLSTENHNIKTVNLDTIFLFYNEKHHLIWSIINLFLTLHFGWFS